MLKRIKTKIVTKLIIIMSVICLSQKTENIALSNLCCNDVKRNVRNRYSYNKEYWLEIE